ncbi:Cysteine desulfurase (plasmid) [Rhodovastum atsumiense]|uniref:aminotransferase class V-fold PLP-dependent enzyme n=1 Tax=Rhodovastum atsumiense TaxID=504468 RepID=UPI0020249313|nr:aminotransferase class V-fold PLP-dependent enzyme [Rhodovastum atsumiense]CAH2605490.1 Cysteine desulfurase [Rhodovastum atsumiense]
MTDSPSTAWRDLFDIPDGLIYADAAFMTPIPHRVREAGEAGILRKTAPWTLSRASFYDGIEALRGAASGLIGAAADDIAIVAATSYGIATAAANLPLAAGEAVLTMQQEHPSQVFAWIRAAEQAGAVHEELPRPDDSNWTSAILRRLEARQGPRIAILALTHVHWTDGTALDLETIGAAARQHGAALVVDGTQSVGVRPLDVRRVQPDFLAFATYKWLLGPYGLALLYAAPHRQSGQPLEEHTFSRLGADQITNRYGRELRFMPGARRYDMGERANFVTVPMAVAGIGILQEIGVPRIEARLRALTDRLVKGASALDLHAAPHRAAHLLGLTGPGFDAAAAVAALRARNIHVSAREDRLRIGLHIYNDERDVDALLQALAEFRQAGR